MIQKEKCGMDKQEYEKIYKIAEIQEQKLRFSSFSNREAWELGSFIVNKAYEQNIDLAVSIRKLNGAVVFQHLMENTTKDNQNWMQRKFNTVSLTEYSSLRAWAMLGMRGETAASRGLSEFDYAFCGGGFPVRLTTGEIAAVVIVSNLPHMQDHQTLIDMLAQWLKVSEVPTVL